jgi:hypothetical protein
MYPTRITECGGQYRIEEYYDRGIFFKDFQWVPHKINVARGHRPVRVPRLFDTLEEAQSYLDNYRRKIIQGDSKNWKEVA